jgi:phage tail-like protein
MARYTEPPPGEMLKYLPAIYSEADGADGQFLQKFLAAFEKLLLGRADPQSIPAETNLHHYRGASVPLSNLEMTIANIADLFDPEKTRDEFLPWLAGWAAFSLRRDLPVESQRKFLMEIFRLYRRRGTKENLERLLTIFTVGAPTITEDDSSAHYFKVELVLLEDKGSKILDTQEIERQIATAYALIDLEKPAHTSYKLNAVHVSMQIGVRSIIGKDTLLGIIQ